MPGSKTTYLGLGLTAALGIVGLVACGSDSSSDDTGSAGSSAAGAAGSAGSAGSGTGCADCKSPPDKPASGAQGDGSGQVFAIRSIDLGGNWEVEPDHWKSLGYDLDGRKTVVNSTDHCKLTDGAAAYVKVDGNNGIDNSFGQNILPQLPSDANASISDSINKGDVTVLIQIDKLGAGADYVDLPAAIYAAGGLKDANGAALTPKWDGTDEWPVFCELLEQCLESGTPAPPANKSKVLFPSSYVNAGTWVSGSKGSGTIAVALAVAGYSLDLTVHSAVLSAKLGSGNPPASGSDGVIAGILVTDEVLDSLGKLAGKLNSSFCDGDTLDNFKAEIVAASDILSDGSQDPAKTCNAITVGFGFTLQSAKLGKALDKAPAAEDPCADAGAR